MHLGIEINIINTISTMSELKNSSIEIFIN
jgi:hypothetical protein